MADEDAQFGIDRARHQDLAGRRWHVWWRRVVLSVVAALPILALLNVFGQHAGPRSVQSPDADPLDCGCRLPQRRRLLAGGPALDDQLFWYPAAVAGHVTGAKAA